MCIIFITDKMDTARRTNNIFRNSKKLFQNTANMPQMLSL